MLRLQIKGIDYKVSFSHFEVDDEDLMNLGLFGESYCPKNLAFETHTATMCVISDSLHEVGVGYSICQPPDIFRKDKGRVRSLARALKDGRFTKPERAQVWKQYHAVIKNGGRK